jgi:acyl-coenzyme A thioesterase PaaI-like protein
MASLPAAGPRPHGGFIGRIGIRKWFTDGVAYGDVRLSPWVLGPAGGLRLGVAAILADLVIGIPASGRTMSTVELSLRWLGDAPASGSVTAAGRVLKWGDRLMFGESSLLDSSGATVGWAVGTFLTGEVGAPSELTTEPTTWGGADSSHDSVREALRAEVLGPGQVVMPVDAQVMNGPGGTVQGGIQACLAELATEGAMPESHTVAELAIRYLNRVKVGPLRAVATPLASRGPTRTVRVELVDAGNSDRLVSLVVATVQLRTPDT